MNPEDVKKQLAKRLAARNSILPFTELFTPNYEIGWVHQEVCDLVDAFIEAVERGLAPRLMVFLPPRHGKSQIISRMVPAYVLGKHPDWEIIAASATQTLSNKFGRYVRTVMKNPLYQELFPKLDIDPSVMASDLIGTKQLGSYSAVGIGGHINGSGAHVLIIDDPIKDAAAADSLTQREALWDWYVSTAYTRLTAGGGIFVVHCMAGGTPVLRPDGSETPLRDIRPGDEVATYDPETLTITTSKVLNHINHGPDLVFAIKMISGRVVRANARHPFLVQREGQTEWVKVANLKPGDQLLGISTLNTLESSVLQMGAQSKPSAKDCANPTTTKPTGRQEKGEGPQTKIETPISRTATESPSNASTPCSSSRATSVPSADKTANPRPRQSGSTHCASTIATTPGPSEHSCATTATSPSGGDTAPITSTGPLNTCEIIPDAIVEIVEDGTEDVFDIEVERTENFIAGGLVSHNTRWHEADLAGQLLDLAKNDPEADQWMVYEYPAIATKNEKHRKIGDALDENRWPLEALNKKRHTMPPRWWSALFQQSPSPEDGDFFLRKWFKQHPVSKFPKPENLVMYLTTDFGLSDSDDSDPSVLMPFGVDEHKNMWFFPGYVHDRLTPHDNIDAIFRLHEQYHFSSIIMEKGTTMRAIGPFLREEMQKRGKFLHIIEMSTGKGSKSESAKVLRARAAQARLQAGTIYFPEERHVQETVIPEFLKFPAGKHDDIVDAISYACLAADNLARGAPALPSAPSGTARDNFDARREASRRLDNPTGRSHIPRRLNGRPRRRKK